ncbi:hypothetical protein DP116_19620 [Brasilonema bromeliae SPC951]|uniref:Erythromycin biosynthesis protein CIII-like C-terminal domain-containing protein n=1 Tax=Brasilonema bromeliae SPC951 TaxID=385972 RepID=A0ABX1PAR1_9CYAN|nr:hypothetical protein [Brasilonema bromeliae SPC951]
MALLIQQLHNWRISFKYCGNIQLRFCYVMSSFLVCPGYMKKLTCRGQHYNVRVEKFLPHAHLLPYVDVMVTNGGFNGVQIALANGVPMVTAGQTEEKPEICARVQWAGVGVDLKTSTPTPKQIQEAVMKIVNSSQYRQRAENFKTEMSHYDAPTLATKLLEQLASTNLPVFRTFQ